MTFLLDSWDQPIEDLHMWDRKPEVVEQHAVPSKSNPEQAYHVRRVECLSKPFQDADVVDDTQQIWLCSCPDARYRRWPNEEPKELTHGTDCKHCREFKAEKAQNDESQTTLAPTPVGDK